MLVPQTYFDVLLRRTVTNAAAMPFYAGRWPTSALERVQAVSDLELLPCIERREVQEADLFSFGSTQDARIIHHTKGTSGRGLLFRFRTAQEIDFLGRFFTKLYEVDPRDHSGPGLFVLQESDSFHGTPIPIPFSGDVLRISSDRKGLDHFVEIVGRKLPISGGRSVNALSGTPAFLFLASLNFLRCGGDARAAGIEVIATQGGVLSSWRRGFLERTWGCPVVDNFSLSEIFASAVCDRVQGWHVFRPTVIAEFLHPATREPMREGIAVLVLTELAPYVTAQPLIRYWTGDLVEVGSERGHPAIRAFRPLGRKDDSVLARDGRLIVSQHAILEAIEETPGIAWTYHHSWIRELFGTIPIDLPHVGLQTHHDADGHLSITFEIETQFPPAAFAAEAGGVAEAFRERLIAKSPWLRAGLEAGRCSLSAVAVVRQEPGSIEY